MTGRSQCERVASCLLAKDDRQKCLEAVGASETASSCGSGCSQKCNIVGYDADIYVCKPHSCTNAAERALPSQFRASLSRTLPFTAAD